MSTSPQTVAKLPVVDFSKEDSLKPGTSSWLSAQKDVCQALEELGCFIVILSSNKVSLELQNTIFTSLNDLFDLPMEIKNARGDGYSTLNPAHEGFRILQGTNPEETQKFTDCFWPNGNDQFRCHLTYKWLIFMLSICSYLIYSASLTYCLDFLSLTFLCWPVRVLIRMQKWWQN